MLAFTLVIVLLASGLCTASAIQETEGATSTARLAAVLATETALPLPFRRGPSPVRGG